MPDLLDAIETGSSPAPDAETAAAAIAAAMPADEQTPDVGDRAASTPPGSAEVPPAGDTVKRAPGRPPRATWSDSRIRRASRKELQAKLRELQSAPPPPPSSIETGGAQEEPAPALAIDPATLVTPLAQSFGMVSELAASVYGDHWKLSDAERATLGAVWAPPLAPLLGSAGPSMPWVAALLATVSVFAPKWLQHQQAAKLAAAAAPPPLSAELRGPDA